MGAKAPFFLYKNMDNLSKSIDICYKRGTLIGLKEAMILLKEQEIALMDTTLKLEEEIKELEKEEAKI